MKAPTLALVLLVLAITSPLSAEQDPCRTSNDPDCREIKDARCRQANETMLQTMKSTQLEKPRDSEEVKSLIARVEKMLADNRRQGVDECRSWADFSRIVVNQ